MQHSTVVTGPSSYSAGSTIDVSDTSLPNETLESIFHGLPPSALAAVTRVSHRWKAVSERILYTQISISDNVNQTSQIPIKTIRCCEALLHHPHLAEVVREFHIRWYCGFGERFPASLERVFEIHIMEALRNLPLLESLELSLALGKQHVEGWTLFQECTFPLLRHLVLSGVGNARLSIHSQALPLLYSFRGSPSTAASVLPGRPVQSLSLIGQDFIADDDLPKLGLSSIPLRYLDLSSMSITPNLLRHISKHLMTVECLRIRLALRHTLHFALSGIRLLAGLTTLWSAFERLTHLDLSPTSVDGVGAGNAAQESSLCTAWAGTCPSLKRIVFPSKTEWMVTTEGVWVPQISC